ncbi:unnamed protein product, partial [Discosporangium mesarthrocarpum]
MDVEEGEIVERPRGGGRGASGSVGAEGPTPPHGGLGPTAAVWPTPTTLPPLASSVPSCAVAVPDSPGPGYGPPRAGGEPLVVGATVMTEGQGGTGMTMALAAAAVAAAETAPCPMVSAPPTPLPSGTLTTGREPGAGVQPGPEAEVEEGTAPIAKRIVASSAQYPVRKLEGEVTVVGTQGSVSGWRGPVVTDGCRSSPDLSTEGEGGGGG